MTAASDGSGRLKLDFRVLDKLGLNEKLSKILKKKKVENGKAKKLGL